MESRITAAALVLTKRPAAIRLNSRDSLWSAIEGFRGDSRAAFYTRTPQSRGWPQPLAAHTRSKILPRKPPGCQNDFRLTNRGVIFAEPLQALAQPALQRCRCVGIERDQIPQWLAAILAQISKRRRIGVGMACYVFTDRSIRVAAQSLQSLGIRARMLADQTQQIEIFFRSLLGQFLQHFRLGIGAQYQPDLLIPSRIDLIEFTRARVNQFFQRTPFLLGARDR